MRRPVCAKLPGGGSPGREDAAPFLRPGGYDRAEGGSPLHLVNAWAAEQGLALGQMAVAGKSNEITVLPKLLELLSLQGRVITADALHCQRQVAQQVVEPAADYALALKGNQGTLNDDVRLLLEDPATPVAEATTVGKGHGRIEVRPASVSGDVAWLQEEHQWRRAPVARLAGGGQGHRPTSKGRPNWGGNPLLSAEPGFLTGAVPSGSMTLCAATGGLRTSCTGAWMWCSTRTRHGTGRGTAPRIWPCCGSWQ